MAKYKLSLETLPLWGILLLFLSFFGLYGTFLFIGAFGPNCYEFRQLQYHFDKPEDTISSFWVRL